MSRTKSKNRKTPTRSPPKTRKSRQTKMTDYYKRNKKVPTFQEIFEHRNMFPETKIGLSHHTWRDFVEYLDTLKSKENPYKIQLFCADANIEDVEDLDDPCDYDNMLDIRKPLTKKYLDNLLNFAANMRHGNSMWLMYSLCMIINTEMQSDIMNHSSDDKWMICLK